MKTNNPQRVYALQIIHNLQECGARDNIMDFIEVAQKVGICISLRTYIYNCISIMKN